MIRASLQLDAMKVLLPVRADIRVIELSTSTHLSSWLYVAELSNTNVLVVLISFRHFKKVGSDMDQARRRPRGHEALVLCKKIIFYGQTEEDISFFLQAQAHFIKAEFQTKVLRCTARLNPERVSNHCSLPVEEDVASH